MTNTDLVALALTRRLVADGSAERLRRANGLSLADIGTAIGTAPTTVWRWENGQRVPHGAIAIRYARVLSELANVTDTI